MTVTVNVAVTVRAPKDRVWRVVTDIENSAEIISANRHHRGAGPAGGGLAGLRWDGPVRKALLQDLEDVKRAADTR